MSSLPTSSQTIPSRINIRWATDKAAAPVDPWSPFATDHASSSTTTQGDITSDELLSSAEPSIFTLNENSWERKTILSVDGGGIRGFTSLLLLQELMKRVGTIEQAEDHNAVSSAYSPLVDSRADDEQYLGYRPCHYFDYIGGTSTGGLIAIMLGRLRMTIDATMVVYKKLSAEVFMRPSSRLTRSLRNNSSATRRESLRKIFDSLMPEQPSSNEVRGEFKSDSIRCKTIVCSIKSSQKKDFKEPFLFRSYDHGRMSYSPFERNPGNASVFDIQLVASATLGAPSYLKSVQVQESRYYDGAIELNNPSWEVINEVNLLNRKRGNSIRLLLSVGGGNTKSNTPKDLFGDKSLQQELNDISEYIDKKLTDESERQAFSYYRLDVDKGLQDVRLNDWKPKTTGESTLRRIESAFKNCLENGKLKSKIHDCAQALVRIRLSRAQTVRWEAFATGIRYHCPIPHCEYQTRRFETRNELLDHLQIEHGKPPPDAEHYEEIQSLLNAGRIRSS